MTIQSTTTIINQHYPFKMTTGKHCEL